MSATSSYEWSEKKYGSDKIGHVTVTRGKKHDYLGMVLDYSQIGAFKIDIFSLGKGAIIADSTKQKCNSRSSTEAELKGIDDEIVKVEWVRRFIQAQGFKIKRNI